MFFLGFFTGAAFMVAAFYLANRFEELKKWKDNDKTNG